MKKLLVGLAMIGSTLALQAQVVVWSQNFDSAPLGAYGAHTTDFAGGANVTNTIVTPGFGGTGNAMSVAFDTVSGTTVNFQTATLASAPSGATSADLSHYILSFDMAIQGVDISAGYGGLQISVQGNDGGIFGAGAVSPFIVPPTGTANSGFQHYSYNLADTGWTVNGGGLNPSTATSLAFGIGVVAYGNGMTASPETFLVDNIRITMVPEPTTVALCGLGLAAGVVLLRRRRIA